MQSLLDSLVIDTENDHNTQDTAKRVAKMWIKEVFGGRYNAFPRVTSFPNMGYKSMYTSGPISIRSTCAHHFQNIVGNAWVGIIPNGEVIGLSKFNRIVHHIAERPQIQEEMTTQIAEALQEYAHTKNIAVVVKAEHHCMTHRGVREHESDMTTAIMLGAFKEDPATREGPWRIRKLKKFGKILKIGSLAMDILMLEKDLIWVRHLKSYINWSCLTETNSFKKSILL